MTVTRFHHIDQQVAGWAWVVTELKALAVAARAEADRLLGPERGE